MKIFLRTVLGISVLLVAASVTGFLVLKSMDFNSYRGLISEQVKAATGRELIIAGKLNLKVSLSPSVTVEGVRLANAPWGSRKDMVVLSRLEAEVQILPLLGGEVRINRLALSGLDVLLEVDGQGRTNWDMASTGPPHERGQTDDDPFAIPMANRVLLRDIKVSYRDARDGTVIATTVQSFAMEAKDTASPMHVVFKAAFADVPVNASGRIGSLRALAESGRYPVYLDVDGAGLKTKIEGHVEDPRAVKGIDFKIAVKSGDMATTISSIRAAIRAAQDWRAPAIPAEATFGLKGQGKTYALDGIKARIGGSDLTGTIKAVLGGRVPEFSGSLAATRLDLNEIVGPASEAGETSDGRVFSAGLIPTETLRGVNIDFAAKIESIVFKGGVGVRNANARILLKDGRLTIPLTFIAGGGPVKSDLTFDGTRPIAAMSLRLDGTGIDWGQALSDGGRASALGDSKAEISADIKGTGRSVREIMGSLNGDAKLVVGPGRIHNKMLDRAGGDMVGQVLGAVNPFAKTDEFSTLHCAVARVTVKNGVADAKDGLALETGKMTVAGGGQVDLRDETLDLAFRPEAKQGIGVGDMVGLVRVSGTLAEPSVGIDALEAVKSALGAGASIVTLGLSETAKSLFGGGKSATETSPCQVALGAKPQAAPQAAPPARAQPAKPAAPKQPAKKDESVGGAIRGVGEGITKGLKGILGQ